MSEPHPLELHRLSVFIDFDGTASVADVTMALLDRFCAGRFEPIDALYETGAIGSRRYVEELWPLLDPVPLSDLVRAAAAVALDPGFAPLVGRLRGAGAEVLVVSDGLGFYVPRACATLDVGVLANGIDPVSRRPTFPSARPECPCAQCGTCKALPVADARARGQTTVVVGDGTSDRFGAAEADIVFAKGRLVDWCRASGIAYRPFVGLGDVGEALWALAAPLG